MLNLIHKKIKRAKRKKIHKHEHVLWILSLGVFAGGILLLWVSALPLPDFASFEQRKIIESTKIFDRTGEVLLFDVHKDIKRTIVPFSDISRHVKNATIAIEDSEFYDHKGVRPTAILRAAIVNFISGERQQGGSTITQQVIKNSLLSNEKLFTRKIKEAVLAIKLERVLDKDSILETYLNESPFGGNIYGIQEASLAFFGKESKDLTLAESAYLAALPKAPTYFSPYGNHVDALINRKNIIIDRMLELGFITEEDARSARVEEVLFSPKEEQGIKAPHFVIYIRELLEKTYGGNVNSQGLKVITTLDWDIQQKTESIVNDYALSNTDNFNASNAGVIIIEPETGHILAMVGSRNYFDEEIDGNFNITLAHRQPGSAIKPFVYATAFKKGYTPETKVFDLKTEFSSSCNPDGTPHIGVDEDVCYSPVNYDGVFRGPVSLRSALAQSMNIPAVKTLYLSGLTDSLKTINDVGISSLTDINRYGLTLVLGGGEVSLLELSSAYGVFANEGIKTNSEQIISISDKFGNIVFEPATQSKKVLDENTTRQINDILSDNDARAPAFGYNSPLLIPGYSVAAKTGTTNDYRDAWIIGYTPEIVVGAWAGNNDNSSMEKKVAGFVIAPMWNEIMRNILPDFNNTNFTPPEPTQTAELKPVLAGFWEGSRSFFIDTISGKQATQFTPEETKERRVSKEIHSILYWVDRNDPQGPIPNTPEKDSQFESWETQVREWAVSQNIIDETEDSLPKEFDDIHTPELSPKINTYSPIETTIFNPQDKILTSVSVSSNFEPNQVDFFFNDSYIGSSKKEPYITSFTPTNFDIVSGENIITIRVYDAVRNRVDKIIPINITSI